MTLFRIPRSVPPAGTFCAWHDYTGDTTLSGGGVSSPYGKPAFTNLPYITDTGTSCGQNSVNAGAAGTLDGVSIVEGHEYAETVTDQNPAGGWTSSDGQENGDKCAYAGQTVTLKFTGVEDSSLQTSFVIDDSTLNVS